MPDLASVLAFGCSILSQFLPLSSREAAETSPDVPIRPLFTALGDETRQSIFLSLLESDRVGIRVGELTQRTHLSRPAVSHHLRVLRQAGLVRVHREGTRNYYYPNADAPCWDSLRDLAQQICRVVAQAAAQGYPNLSEP